MMQVLEPKLTLNKKHSAYCGVCWEPIYCLWVDDEAPDYSACPFGPYTAQTCPEATAAVTRAAFSAELKRQGLTLAQYMARSRQQPPDPQSERASSREEP